MVNKKPTTNTVYVVETFGGNPRRLLFVLHRSKLSDAKEHATEHAGAGNYVVIKKGSKVVGTYGREGKRKQQNPETGKPNRYQLWFLDIFDGPKGTWKKSGFIMAATQKQAQELAKRESKSHRPLKAGKKLTDSELKASKSADFSAMPKKKKNPRSRRVWPVLQLKGGKWVVTGHFVKETKTEAERALKFNFAGNKNFKLGESYIEHSEKNPLINADDPRIVKFIEARHEGQRASFAKEYPGQHFDAAHRTLRAIQKKKYINIDADNSALFMVDRETGEIFGTKAYGKIDRRRRYGNISKNPFGVGRLWKVEIEKPQSAGTVLALTKSGAISKASKENKVPRSRVHVSRNPFGLLTASEALSLLGKIRGSKNPVEKRAVVERYNTVTGKKDRVKVVDAVRDISKSWKIPANDARQQLFNAGKIGTEKYLYHLPSIPTWTTNPAAKLKNGTVIKGKHIKVFLTDEAKKNPSKRNIEMGFYKGGQFHPIRASVDYSPDSVSESFHHAPTSRSAGRLMKKFRAGGLGHAKQQNPGKGYRMYRISGRALAKGYNSIPELAAASTRAGLAHHRVDTSDGPRISFTNSSGKVVAVFQGHSKEQKRNPTDIVIWKAKSRWYYKHDLPGYKAHATPFGDRVPAQNVIADIRIKQPGASVKVRQEKETIKRNLDHRDAQHPIEVRHYWQGRKGYLTPWQRAHQSGQMQLFTMNPSKAKRITFKGFDGKEYHGLYVGKDKGLHRIVYKVHGKFGGNVMGLLNDSEYKSRVKAIRGASANPYLMLVNGKLRFKEPGAHIKKNSDSLFETFHGMPSTRIDEVDMPDSAPKNTERLGDMLCIFYQVNGEPIAGSGTKAEGKTKHWIDFPKGVFADSNQKGNQYYLVAQSGKLPQGPPNHIFGPATRIEYSAAKPHIEKGSKAKRPYYHAFGEEDGKRPILRTDNEGHLILEKGNYRTEWSGINN